MHISLTKLTQDAGVTETQVISKAGPKCTCHDLLYLHTKPQPSDQERLLLCLRGNKKMAHSETNGFWGLPITFAALSIKLKFVHTLTPIAYARAIHPFKHLLKMH